MTNGYRYSICRLLGHAWHTVPSDWTPPAGTQPITIRCERCDIERRDTVNRNTGDVVGRRYTYPEGYLFSKNDGEPAPKRVDFRLAFIEDQIAKQRAARQERRVNR